jgi:ATP-dependent Zn protease
VVYSVPKEELHTQNQNQLLAEIKMCLGGYASEKLVTGSTTSGVIGDFQKAMGLAHSMVWRLGMGGKYLGDWELLASIEKSRISESVRSELNAETNHILQSCLKDVEQMLAQERVLLDRFANELLKREELEYDESEAIFSEYGKSRAQVAALAKPAVSPKNDVA